MVRKWSYLNLQQTHENEIFKPLLKTKSFKVFRKTTRFKKFTRGITKAVRQKHMQRKFNTSYYILKHITKSWSFSYIQSKQVERFIQSMGYSKLTSSSPNHDVFYAISKSLDSDLNSHLFSCSKRLIYRFLVNQDLNNTLFIKTRVKDSKLSFAQTDSFDSLSNNKVTNPLTLYLDNIHYHPYSVVLVSEYKKTLDEIIQASTNHVLSLTTVYYKTLILVSLLSIIQQK